jgi:hypothetical protein
LEQVKRRLNIPLADTSQDVDLEDSIAAVTEVVEHLIGPVEPREVVETHDGGSNAVVLRRPPVLSITSVTENGLAVPAGTSGYSVDLAAGVLYRGRYGQWAYSTRGAVTVTYQAGRLVVPASASMAARDLVAFNHRPEQAGSYSPFPTEEPVSGQILGFFIPNRVRQMLAPHEQITGIG